jgi:DNA helicase-2/ATP-dependent DNA helicase PcrA
VKRPSLTKEQSAVVELPDGPYLLTAPPGSGKTEVLVRRVIHIIENSPSDLFRILALTYTVKAAGELCARVAEEVPEDEQWRVTAQTFHSFCLDLLENYGEPVGVVKPVTVFDDLEDKRTILTPVLDEVSMRPLSSVSERAWHDLFTDIARNKTDLLPPESTGSEPVLDGCATFREAYEAYELALANAGGIDFEGMLGKAVELLAVDPWVAEHQRRQFRHILIDEGQEMNTAQYELLRALCGAELRNVFVVADADQSINSYAGGGPQFLTRFARDFGATRHELTTNFRSARRIVEAVSALRSRIGTSHAVVQPMSAATLAAGCVRAVSYVDEQAEADSVATWIDELLRSGLDPTWLHPDEDPSVSPEEVCIQGRTRYAFDHIVEALAQRSIPFVVRTAEGRLFDTALGRLTFYGLRLVDNPRDLPSRRRFIAELGRAADIGASREDLTLAIRALGECGAVPAAWAELLADAASGNAEVSHVVDALGAIELDSSDLDAMAWALDRKEFGKCWTDYQAATRPPDRSLGGFLKYLTQLQRGVRDEPGIRILTPHRARGLGFRVVVILGMNEGTFPYYLARDQKEIDEERRAVYVAASRAARVLLLTRPRIRFNQYGRQFVEKESRFVAEMGLKMEYL